MATAYEILDKIVDHINLAETRWLAWAKPCTRAYDKAYEVHNATLGAVKESFKMQAEQSWALLNFLLGELAGAWVPRLLSPAKSIVTGAIDELTSVWVKDLLTGMTEDTAKLVKDTLLDQVKSRATGTTDDPYQPVVEKTLDYGSRLEEGIHTRAGNLLAMMIQIKEQSDKWTVPAATWLKNAFVNFMPFIRDMPAGIGSDFEKEFQKKSELEMWIEWGLARDEKWWRGLKNSDIKGRLDSPQLRRITQDSETQKERITMRPILMRLLTLGVPSHAVSTIETVRNLGGIPYTTPILDMIKFIEWAKLQRQLPTLVSNAIHSGIFTVKENCRCSLVGEH